MTKIKIGDRGLWWQYPTVERVIMKCGHPVEECDLHIYDDVVIVSYECTEGHVTHSKTVGTLPDASKMYINRLYEYNPDSKAHRNVGDE